jgi:phosphopantetheine adenylyltransferase
MYNNVLLSDSDLEKLKTEFKDYEERIERLSEYIASTGKSYKNHLATIRSWAKKDKAKSYGRTAEEKNAGYCFNQNEDSLDDLF